MTTYQDEVRVAYLKHRANGIQARYAKTHALYEVKYGTDEGRQTRRVETKRGILPSTYGIYAEQHTLALPNGWSLKVEIEYDSDSEAPWENCDGMGVIVECHGHPGDSYADWILNSDRNWYRYFDWKATLPEAIKDGWDTLPYQMGTKHERAMRAMRSTYDHLRRWCNDDWYYVGLIVTLLDENDEELGEDSCWGYESCSISYITSEARSRAAYLIKEARKEAREAARIVRRDNRFRDAMACGL